jgi:hypothetical protein
MFDGLYIASLSAHYLFEVDIVHMYCISKQIDVFVMALWSLFKNEYSLPIYNLFRIGEDYPKGENTEKFQAGNRYTKLSKILGELPPREEEYPGKLLPANRNTN